MEKVWGEEATDGVEPAADSGRHVWGLSPHGCLEAGRGWRRQVPRNPRLSLTSKAGSTRAKKLGVLAREDGHDADARGWEARRWGPG